MQLERVYEDRSLEKVHCWIAFGGLVMYGLGFMNMFSTMVFMLFFILIELWEIIDVLEDGIRLEVKNGD